MKEEFAIRFAEYVAQEHYRLHNVEIKNFCCTWRNESGEKTTSELMIDFKAHLYEQAKNA